MSPKPFTENSQHEYTTNPQLTVGTRVRVTFGPPPPGWMDGEILQINQRKQRAIIRWDADRMTSLIPLDQITAVLA